MFDNPALLWVLTQNYNVRIKVRIKMKVELNQTKYLLVNKKNVNTTCNMYVYEIFQRLISREFLVKILQIFYYYP